MFITTAMLDALGVLTFAGASALDDWTDAEFHSQFGNALGLSSPKMIVVAADGNYNHYIVENIADIRHAWNKGQGIHAVYAIPHDLWEEHKGDIKVVYPATAAAA